MNTTPPVRVGKWLPSDHAVLERWLARQIDLVERVPQPLLPVVEQFAQLIESNADLFMLFHQMFSQVPDKPPYNLSPTLKPQVRDYRLMLRLISQILTTAPPFDETDLVGFPINAILDWSMATPGGFAAFLDHRVNRQLKNILGEWARFLGSKDSCYVLSDDVHTGWFGKDALKKMAGSTPDFVFEHVYQCDPHARYYGFQSWDDFFTRKFRPGVRPVAAPDDDDVLVNACESSPYCLAHGVALRDTFWIKAQPYSISHLFNDDKLSAQFDQGIVYQAFLDALAYHRWHSPVSGHIVKAYVIDGTYYAEALSEGDDPAGPNNSQAYITHLATRCLIFIEADNPDIGLMCFVAVGMAEVSSCEITVYEGQHVDKGDQLGMFHFGGSTHCLIFRPGVKLNFDLHGHQPGLNSQRINLNARIATVVRTS